MRQMKRRARGDSTIALINVVFLMLIFFMVAGTIAPSPGGDVALVRTADLQGQAPRDALVIRADGSSMLGGAEMSPEAYAAGLGGEPARIVPDRDLPAETLVRIASQISAAGAENVLMVTERGLE